MIVICLAACNDRKVHLKETVSINFRISYAGLANVPDYIELPEDTIPKLDYIEPSKDSSVLNYLADLGLVDSNKFIIRKAEDLAKDTIITNLPNGEKVKFYFDTSPTLDTRVIKIEQGRSKDTIEIERRSLVPKLICFGAFKDYRQRLLVYDSWYFMNGDMYTLTVYDIK